MKKLTPEQILHEARFWEGMCFDPGHSAYLPADSLRWEAEADFDLTRISGFSDGRYDHLFHAQQDVCAEVCGSENEATQYFDDMCRAIQVSTIEPIFIVEGTDRRFWVWEGNHRTGMAHVLEVSTMPAYVGYQPV